LEYAPLHVLYFRGRNGPWSATLFQQNCRTSKLYKSHAKKQITDDGETGRICISAIPTIAPYLIPAILKSLKGQFSKANFIISEDKTEDLLKRCSNGDVDVGILALPASAKYLTIESMFEEELMLATSSDNPLCKKTRLVGDDLKDEPFVLLRETHCLVDSIESFCNDNQFQPVTTSRIDQLTTVQHLVALDHGISFVPKMASAIDLDGNGDRPRRQDCLP